MEKSPLKKKEDNKILPEISKEQILMAVAKAQKRNMEIDKATKIDYKALSERAGS